MKLLLENSDPRAYGSIIAVDGVEFVVVALVKQGFYNGPYWLYEVKIRSKNEPSGA